MNVLNSRTMFSIQQQYSKIIFFCVHLKQLSWKSLSGMLNLTIFHKFSNVIGNILSEKIDES